MEERVLSELSRTEYLRRIASALESMATAMWSALVIGAVYIAVSLVVHA